MALLADDGRMSFTDLAKETGLSVSAVHQRVRRLQKRGVIVGFAAQFDSRLIGLPLTAFVSIKPIDPAAPDDAPERLAHLQAIEAAIRWREESYILKVRVGSPNELEELLQQIRAAANVATRDGRPQHPWESRRPPCDPGGEPGQAWSGLGRGDDEGGVAEADSSPGRTRAGPVSRQPLTRVPFIEPRSEIIQPSSAR